MCRTARGAGDSAVLAVPVPVALAGVAGGAVRGHLHRAAVRGRDLGGLDLGLRGRGRCLVAGGLGDGLAVLTTGVEALVRDGGDGRAVLSLGAPGLGHLAGRGRGGDGGGDDRVGRVGRVGRVLHAGLVRGGGNLRGDLRRRVVG